MSSPSDVVPITLDLDDCGLTAGFDGTFELETTEPDWLLKLKFFVRYRFPWIVAALVLIVFVILYLQNAIPGLDSPIYDKSENAQEGEKSSEKGKDGSNPEDIAVEILENSYERQTGDAGRMRSGLVKYDPAKLAEGALDIIKGNGAEVVAGLAYNAEVRAKQDRFEYAFEPEILDLPAGAEFKTLHISLGIYTDEETANLLLAHSDKVHEHLSEIVAEQDVEKTGVFKMLDAISAELKIRLSEDLTELNIGRVRVNAFSVLEK